MWPKPWRPRPRERITWECRPSSATATKADAGAPTGVALLAEIRRRVTLPLVAIGGITLANAPAVIEAGADAVCAIAAVVTRPEVKAEIDKFQKLFCGNPSIF